MKPGEGVHCDWKGNRIGRSVTLILSKTLSFPGKSTGYKGAAAEAEKLLLLLRTKHILDTTVHISKHVRSIYICI